MNFYSSAGFVQAYTHTRTNAYTHTHTYMHILTDTQEKWGATGVDLIVLFQEMDCGSVWDSEMEKLLSTQTSALCSVGA